MLELTALFGDSMKLRIESVGNGYILHVSYDENGIKEKFVYEDAELENYHALHALQKMLNDIVNLLGMSGSRHDKQRIYVKLEPGDKYIDASSQE